MAAVPTGKVQGWGQTLLAQGGVGASAVVDPPTMLELDEVVVVDGVVVVVVHLGQLQAAGKTPQQVVGKKIQNGGGHLLSSGRHWMSRFCSINCSP